MIGKDVWFLHNIDGLVQECRNYGALAVELLQSCTKPSIWYIWTYTHNKTHPREKRRHSICFNHYSDTEWVSRRLKSPATRLYCNSIYGLQTKEASNGPNMDNAESLPCRNVIIICKMIVSDWNQYENNSIERTRRNRIAYLPSCNYLSYGLNSTSTVGWNPSWVCVTVPFLIYLIRWCISSLAIIRNIWEGDRKVLHPIAECVFCVRSVACCWILSHSIALVNR